MSNPIQGNQVLIVTPFKPDLSLDEPSLVRLVDHLVEQGAAGIIALGTTGEFFSLSDDEKRRVVDVVAERTRGRTPLIVGVANTDPVQSAGLAAYAKERGAAAVLAPPPYYISPSSEGMVEHFSRIAQAGIDLMVYDGGGGIEIPIDVVAAVQARSTHMRYVKLTTPKVSKVAEIRQRFQGAISVFAGEDLLIMPELIEGADGLTTAAGNLRCAELGRIFDLVQQGLLEEAQALHDRCIAPQALVTGAVRNEFVQCFKVALKMTGIIDSDAVRPPLHRLSESRIVQLKGMLRHQGLLPSSVR
ncbi:dihydrodipicolinate synthase family protein [Parasulfuritortus cantonensis]|uniref:Dihydrodipicolinate synthase family protein n=1 Tax=Parasulfuritortus cantonensis TaxID=2528202 RepID=A0A4R1BDQ9_9PROT|nr:dihydrodipicolinate synthase family protein [Parasulfuritortus cantonensis]TCJ15220.1 dihydrodipicolinate synthase family protein [Parasulfuritortus cantonensis]